MTKKRVRAKSAKSARRKCKSKNLVVTKVNYIKGASNGGMKTFSVTTKKRKK